MQFIYTYKPLQFFLMTIIGTWAFWVTAAYFSHQKGYEKWQISLMVAGLLVPCIYELRSSART